MGAAWREVKDGPAFDRVLDDGARGEGPRPRGLRTLGMLTEDQAARLKEAGLDAYNHNLDTSRGELPVDHHHPHATTTASRTLSNVRRAGITVCSGGIIGMGESMDDRCEMLRTLANLDPQPESVPINALVRVARHAAGRLPPGRPSRARAHDRRARASSCPARWCACRPAAPRSRARRRSSAMLAGANSIFYGDKLLTTPNPGEPTPTWPSSATPASRRWCP